MNKENIKEYSEKDRLVYLEKKGADIKETKYSSKPYVQKSENFDQKDLQSHSSLSSDQIKKLQEHVNGLGITMKKYLEIVGFDMSELDNDNRSIYLSTLESCKTDPVKRTVLMGRRPVMQTSYKSESYKGFDINANGAKEATKKYKDCDEGNKKYNDGLNIVFRTEESANKEKEEAIKAEEAAKAAKDKKPRKR